MNEKKDNNGHSPEDDIFGTSSNGTSIDKESQEVLDEKDSEIRQNTNIEDESNDSGDDSGVPDYDRSYDIDEKTSVFKKITNKLKGQNKKPLIIASLIIVVLIVLTISIWLIQSSLNKSKVADSSELSASSSGEIVIPEDIETIKYSSTDETVRQGVLKRILGDRVIISPDDETGDVIYYVKDDSLLSSLKAGSHLEYNYVIDDFLPYLTSITSIQTGKITYKGLMTLSIEEQGEIKKLEYSDELSKIIKELKINDMVEYVSQDNKISNIFKINNSTDILVSNQGVNENVNVENPLITRGSMFNRDDFFEEYLIVDNRFPEEIIIEDSDITNNKIDFYNAITDPIWIRIAWRVTDLMPTVPSVDNVNLILTSPSGKVISRTNIDDFGRMWVDGNIINFAIKSPEAGEWSLQTDKRAGTKLGQVEMHVMKLSGFISIDKFGANLISQTELELIWNIGGVPDDGLEMEVYLTSDRFSTMIFSASSKEEVLHTIDKRIIDISNIPKGKYNIIVKVKDLDIVTGEDGGDIPKNTMLVTSETIKDEKDVGILIVS